MGLDNMLVRLTIPEEEKSRCKHPAVHGEHYGYDGRVGKLIASAGETGAWVCFGDDPTQYVGCPLKWLRREP